MEETHHRAVSQKAFFQISSEDISFFTIAFYGLPNITLPIPQELSWRQGSWEESCSSVRWFHRTQRRFSESFFLFVIGGYFLWPYSRQRDAKYLFSDSTEIRLAKRSTTYRCNSVRWNNRTLSSFSKSFFPDFMWGYFLFHHSPLWVSKDPFANSTRTVLAKGFLRGNL